MPKGGAKSFQFVLARSWVEAESAVLSSDLANTVRCVVAVSYI